MARTLIGGLVGGVILFVVGFIFWATPLSQLAYTGIDDARSAAVQTSLAQNLTKSGTGTYVVPWPDTAQGTTLYGRGPIATVHFNTRGFPVEDMNMVVTGLVFALVSGLAIAFGLAAVGGGGRGFANVARLVVLFSLGITIWTVLAQPVFNHHGWGYWVYSFIAQTAGLIAAGLAIARWFLPGRPAAPAAAASHDPGAPEARAE
jgi:hypothetical protein